MSKGIVYLQLPLDAVNSDVYARVRNCPIYSGQECDCGVLVHDQLTDLKGYTLSGVRTLSLSEHNAVLAIPDPMHCGFTREEHSAFWEEFAKPYVKLKDHENG